MSIVSPEFYVLLAIVVLLLAVAPAKARRWLLLLASLLFYFSGNPASAALGALVIAINYLMLRLLVREERDPVRDRIYWASIAFNLVAFVSLKLVFESGIDAANAVRGWTGLALAYPLGLSFIIVMLHGAISDAHSRRYVPTGNAIDFALFGSFFPYVSSGPIERYESMEPQFQAIRGPRREDIWKGAALIGLGLFKKLVVANRVTPYVSAVFDGKAVFSSSTLILAVVLNVVYIYVDFGGYTDMARGAARCMGIEVRPNFDKPFSAHSVTEFWRRWHISFSNWLRDYIFLPLAFSLSRWSRRSGPALAMFLTFAMVGFWHRAAWTFGIFGLLQGLALALEMRFGRKIGNGGGLAQVSLAWAAKLYMLVFFAFSQVFFSAQSVPQAIGIFGRLVHDPAIPHLQEFFGYLGPLMFLLMLASIALWQLMERWHSALTERSAPLFLFACAALVLFLGTSGPGFIYAQF